MKSQIHFLITIFATVFFVCACQTHTHSYSGTWASDETYHWHAAICEHTEEVSDKAAHDWDSGTVTTEATYKAEGEKTYTCTVCQKTKTEKIPIKDTGVKNDFPIDMAKITTYSEISAADAMEKIKIGWNLGNTLDSKSNVVNPSEGNENGFVLYGKSPATFETAWGNPVTTQKFIRYVKSSGFNGIRIPVTWGEHLDSADNIDEDWMMRVKQVVEWSLNEDLYVIINIHHDTGGTGWLRSTSESYDNPKYRNRFEKIWKQIANEFKVYNEKLMFESFNEMLDGEIGTGKVETGGSFWSPANTADFEYINKWNKIFVDTVRATGGNNATRNLICNTYGAKHWEHTFSNFTLPTDSANGKKHLAIQIHNYCPDETDKIDATWKFSDAEQKRLKDDFDRIAKYSKSFGVPIMVGEWGSKVGFPEDARVEVAKYYISESTRRGIACFIWDNGGDNEKDEGSMKLLDRTALTCAQPKILNAIVTSVKNTEAAFDSVEIGVGADVVIDGAKLPNQYEFWSSDCLKDYANKKVKVSLSVKMAVENNGSTSVNLPWQINNTAYSYITGQAFNPGKTDWTNVSGEVEAELGENNKIYISTHQINTADFKIYLKDISIKVDCVEVYL